LNADITISAHGALYRIDRADRRSLESERGAARPSLTATEADAFILVVHPIADVADGIADVLRFVGYARVEVFCPSRVLTLSSVAIPDVVLVPAQWRDELLPAFPASTVLTFRKHDDRGTDDASSLSAVQSTSDLVARLDGAVKTRRGVRGDEENHGRGRDR